MGRGHCVYDSETIFFSVLDLRVPTFMPSPALQRPGVETLYGILISHLHWIYKHLLIVQLPLFMSLDREPILLEGCDHLLDRYLSMIIHNLDRMSGYIGFYLIDSIQPFQDITYPVSSTRSTAGRNIQNN